MKKFRTITILLSLLLLFFKGFSQSNSEVDNSNLKNKRITYAQIEFSIPFVFDPENSANSNIGGLLPAGANLMIGYGYHHNKWIAIGLHTGINTRIDEKLVAMPAFANFRISPQITEKYILHFQGSYGMAFALGRGDLSGDYRRINFGFGKTSKIVHSTIFLEYSEMGFPIHDREKLRSFCLGAAVSFL